MIHITRYLASKLASGARKLSPSVHCCQRTCPWVTLSRRSWTPIRHLEVEKRLRVDRFVLDWNWIPSTRSHTAKRRQQDGSFVASFQLIWPEWNVPLVLFLFAAALHQFAITILVSCDHLSQSHLYGRKTGWRDSSYLQYHYIQNIRYYMSKATAQPTVSFHPFLFLLPGCPLIHGMPHAARL